ncbi:MAG: class I SAM-dependent methyltransferase [Bdellovibrionota bacterium]|nr:class I SAM-dependent methyltransferase [Bdellovibrionota bacterium]
MFFPENELTNYLSKISTTFEVNTAEAGLLFAAIELDLFESFSKDPLTLEQIAKKIDVKKERLLPLLNGLCIMGLLIKDEGFSFPEEYFPFLKKGGRFYIGKALLRFKWTIENLSNLSKIIKGEVEVKGHDVHDEISTAFYLDFVREFNKPYIKIMASRLKEYFKNAKTLLDIGGGHGLYTQKALKNHPHLEGTLLDLPHAIDYAQNLHADKDYFSRLHLLKGDSREVKIEKKYDVITMNDLLHYFTEDEKKDLIKKALGALNEGGVLAITKFSFNEDLTPESSVFFSIKNFLLTGSGYLCTDESLEKIIEELGVKIVKEKLDENKTLYLLS